MKRLIFIYADFNEFKKYLASLPKKEGSKLANDINKIELSGLQDAERMKWVKKIDANLYEIRSQFASNIQRAIYFHYENNEYVITHGFTKKSQKTPLKEKKGKRD